MDEKTKVKNYKRKRLINLEALIYGVLIEKDPFFPITEEKIKEIRLSGQKQNKPISFKTAEEIIKMAEERKAKKSR